MSQEQCKCGKWRDSETKESLPDDTILELPHGLYLCDECKRKR